MPRALTDRELHTLLALIDHGHDIDGAPGPTPAQRELWRSRVTDLVVTDTCRCGTCPSVSLVAASSGPAPDLGEPLPATDAEGVVLTGQLDDALVLAFITGGVPSYLELAPLDDSTVYTEFPEASALSFTAAAPRGPAPLD